MNHLLHNTGRDPIRRKPVAPLFTPLGNRQSEPDNAQVPKEEMIITITSAPRIVSPVPATEFKVGDEVECLPFNNDYPPRERACLGKALRIALLNDFRFGSGTESAANMGNGYYWPLRALRHVTQELEPLESEGWKKVGMLSAPENFPKQWRPASNNGNNDRGDILQHKDGRWIQNISGAHYYHTWLALKAALKEK